MTNCPYDSAVKHHDQAMDILKQLLGTLRRKATPAQLELINLLRHHMRLSFWQARLGQKIGPGTVAATPFCRELLLGPNQRKYLDELCRGMLAAERSLSERSHGSAPWNMLVYGRDQLPQGLGRKQFEIGFVMRLYQMLQELAALNQREASPKNIRSIRPPQGMEFMHMTAPADQT